MSAADTDGDRRRPIAQQAADRLRNHIVVGRYKPGTRLKVDDLRSEFGFSNSPLREALVQLSQEGLVRADARRGFRVSDISIEDFDDLLRHRLSLDVAALVESITIGDDHWESTVVAAFFRLEKVESRLGDGPVALNDEWCALHKSFHMALISGCRSPRTLAWCSSLFDQADRYRRFSASRRTHPRNKNLEHQAIMEAALRRDAESASTMLTAHISRTRQGVLEALVAVD
jgi:DNA-binding GntR family transcriptional regulator